MIPCSLWTPTPYPFPSGIVLAVLLVIFLLVLFFLRGELGIIVKMLDIASKAARDMKFVFLFPVLMSSVAVSYGVFWTATALYIWTVQGVEYKDYSATFQLLQTDEYPGDEYVVYEWDNSMTTAAS